MSNCHIKRGGSTPVFSFRTMSLSDYFHNEYPFLNSLQNHYFYSLTSCPVSGVHYTYRVAGASRIAQAFTEPEPFAALTL